MNSALSRPSRRALLRLAPAVCLARPGRAAAPPARIESITVISQQPQYYPAWPTLVRRRSGELVAAYSGGREGHVCPFGRVEVTRSLDNGKTWGWPQIVMDTPIDDRDAGLMETPKGTLLLNTFTSTAFERYYGKMQEWEADRIARWEAMGRAATPEQRRALVGAWMLRSTDGGMSWSAPYPVMMTNPHGAIALADGRLLHPGKAYPREKGIGVTVSEDDGLTWRLLSQIPLRPGDSVDGYHELHGVETADHRIVVHIRNQNPVNDRETLQTESADGGRTWSIPRPIGVWGLPSHLIRLSDNRLLMSYGYRRPPRGNHARISEDHGRTWSEPIVLSDDGTGDIGYPSTVELPGGELLTLWYEARRSGSIAVKLPPPPLSQLRLARWRLT